MKIELASPLPCESVARAIGAEHSSTAGSFSNIATSSFEADENTLFFALDGRHTSGEEFVRTLAERGIFSVTRKRGAYMLTHENPRAALLSLLFFGIFDDPLYYGQTEALFWLTLGLCL